MWYCIIVKVARILGQVNRSSISDGGFGDYSSEVDHLAAVRILRSYSYLDTIAGSDVVYTIFALKVSSVTKDIKLTLYSDATILGSPFTSGQR